MNLYLAANTRQDEDVSILDYSSSYASRILYKRRAPVQLLEWPIRTNGHRSINSVRYIKAVLAFRAVLAFPLI